jgi:DNA-binding transcriptional MerR regulator
MEEILHTIGELAEKAGVTPRTIRYYTAEGLLPAPETRGRYALYGDEHLRRLQLIARLKEAYLPLEEIKAYMSELTDEQVRQLLAQYDQAPEPATPTSAADYISQVLNVWSVPPMQVKGSLRPAQKTPDTETAGFRLRAPTTPGGPEQERAERVDMPAPPQRLGFAEPLAPAAAASTQPPPAAPPAPPTAAPAATSLLKRLVPQRREAVVPPAAAEETWQRVGLAPGVELHVRESLPAHMRERVARLIERARELFGE